MSLFLVHRFVEAPEPDDYVDRPDAARITGYSSKTFDAWALKGMGPPFETYRGRAFYRAGSLPIRR